MNTPTSSSTKRGVSVAASAKRGLAVPSAGWRFGETKTPTERSRSTGGFHTQTFGAGEEIRTLDLTLPSRAARRVSACLEQHRRCSAPSSSHACAFRSIADRDPSSATRLVMPGEAHRLCAGLAASSRSWSATSAATASFKSSSSAKRPEWLTSDSKLGDSFDALEVAPRATGMDTSTNGASAIPHRFAFWGHHRHRFASIGALASFEHARFFRRKGR